MEIPIYIDKVVNDRPREVMVKGCYEEGCTKDYLKKVFNLNDKLLEGY